MTEIYENAVAKAVEAAKKEEWWQNLSSIIDETAREGKFHIEVFPTSLSKSLTVDDLVDLRSMIEHAGFSVVIDEYGKMLIKW